MYEDKWEPYNISHNIYSANSTPIFNSEGTISDDEYIDDRLILPPDRLISALSVSKPKYRLTPEYFSQIWNCG